MCGAQVIGEILVSCYRLEKGTVLHQVLKRKGPCGFGRVTYSGLPDRAVLVLMRKEAGSQVTEVTGA